VSKAMSFPLKLNSVESLFELVEFEGPEKLLEVWFQPVGNDTIASPQPDNSLLRTASSEEWQEILNEVQCKILSVIHNEYIDAYVLSESSLFVYSKIIVLKTCGKTTLLRAIPKMMELGNKYGLEIQSVFYSRRKYLFPHSQLSPHTSFDEEITYLEKTVRKPGSAYILGRVNGDHWNLYLTEEPTQSDPDQTLEILMTNLDREAMRQFYKQGSFITAKKSTQKSGISDLFPGALMDEHLFEPYGYSMNGILNGGYFTIHITPQPNCSYASFETNISLESYNGLIQRVLSIFNPGKFSVSAFANSAATCHSAKQAFDPSAFTDYKRQDAVHYVFTNYDVYFCHFEKTHT